jgi:hypothetical protein
VPCILQPASIEFNERQDRFNLIYFTFALTITLLTLEFSLTTTPSFPLLPLLCPNYEPDVSHAMLSEENYTTKKNGSSRRMELTDVLLIMCNFLPVCSEPRKYFYIFRWCLGFTYGLNGEEKNLLAVVNVPAKQSKVTLE